MVVVVVLVTRRGDADDDDDDEPPEGVISGFSLKTPYRPNKPRAPAEAYLVPISAISNTDTYHGGASP